MITCIRQVFVQSFVRLNTWYQTVPTIEVYIIKQCHVHTILHHSSIVTSLAFTPDKSHLINTSNDGSTAVFETAVSCLVVHSSGKLALSAGRDKTLRTLNLVKGRPAYTTNLPSMSAYYFFNKIIWSLAGQYYALLLNTKLMIYNVETAGIAFTIENNHKIHDVTFLMEHIVCFGSENGFLHCYDIIIKESI